MDAVSGVALLALITFVCGLVAGFFIGAHGDAYNVGYDEGYMDAQDGITHEAFQ